jgi:hypothetical protein
MNKFLENLKYQAEENPVLALGVTAGLITAINKSMDSISRLMNSTANTKNSKAWAKEVERRVRQAKS